MCTRNNRHVTRGRVRPRSSVYPIHFAFGHRYTRKRQRAEYLPRPLLLSFACGLTTFVLCSLHFSNALHATDVSCACGVAFSNAFTTSHLPPCLYVHTPVFRADATPITVRVPLDLSPRAHHQLSPPYFQCTTRLRVFPPYQIRNVGIYVAILYY